MVIKNKNKHKYLNLNSKSQGIFNKDQIATCSQCRKELPLIPRKQIKGSDQCNCKCVREKEEYYVWSCGNKTCKTYYTNQRVCGLRIYSCRCNNEKKTYKSEMLNPETAEEILPVSKSTGKTIDINELTVSDFSRSKIPIYTLKQTNHTCKTTLVSKATVGMPINENRIPPFTNQWLWQHGQNYVDIDTKNNVCYVDRTMRNENLVGIARTKTLTKQWPQGQKQHSEIMTIIYRTDTERTMPNVNLKGMININKVPVVARQHLHKEEKLSTGNDILKNDKVRPRLPTVSLRSEKKSTGLVAHVTNKELLNELIKAFFQEFHDKRSTSHEEIPDFIHKIHKIQDGSYVLQHPVKVAPLQQLDMRLYFNRLFSFSNWQENSPVSAIKLASAGFYYTGDEQIVRCFSCNLSVSDWLEENNPLLVHQQRSPHCDFIKTKQESNEREATSFSNLSYVQEQPTDNATGTGFGVVEEIARPQSDLQTRSNEDEIGLNTNSIDEDSSIEGISQGLRTLTVASESGNPVLQPSDSPPTTSDNSISEINSASLTDQQPQTQFHQNLGLHEQQGQESHQQNSSEHEQQIQRNVQPNNALLPVEHVAISMPQNGGDVFDYDIMANARHPQYTNSQYRLQSYRNWTHHNMQHPQALAEAGFYYTGTQDAVRCFNCDIGLADWDVHDNPWVEHARHSPYCSFLKHVKGEEFIRNIQDAWREIYTPKHPVYDDITARLQTFRRWPSDLSQTPQQLANAGFYYIGEDDTVRCHYCDGGLRQWEWNDDPWVEHARWFPYCKFVLKMRGVAFIEEVARTYNEIYVNQTQEAPTGAAFEPFYVGDEFSPPEEYTAPENNYQTGQRRNALTTPAAESVLELGYNRNVLIMAINKFVKRTDTRDFTADHLLNIILDTDEGELPPPDEDSDAKQIGLQDIPRIQPEELDTDELRRVNKQIKENVFLCKHCKIRERNMIFLPCGHRDMCETCADEVMICTTCGDFIDKRVKTFLS